VRYTVAVLSVLLVGSALAAEVPALNPARGVYDTPIRIEATPADPGDTLTWSSDGSEPTTPWAGPMDLQHTTVLRVRATGADGTVAEVVHTYLFPADVVRQADMDPAVVSDATYGPAVSRTLAELPSVSILVPGGLSTTETEASLEWVDPDGEDLQVWCGVARTGTTSLGYPKTSLRFYFRGDYGTPEVEFDFWPLDGPGVAPSRDQDALSLRSGHDTVFWLGAQGQYTRNLFMDRSQLEMGHLAPHGGYAHVYENGGYIGLYQVRERFGAAFLSHYLGGEEEDYEWVNEGYVRGGSGAAWAEVMAHATDPEGIQAWMHLPHFLDYMVLNYYAANGWDWTYWHNWAAAGPSRADSGGYRFYSSDSDVVLWYDWTYNLLYEPGPSQLFATLASAGDPDFEVAVADAIHRNLDGDGPLTAENAGARYADIAATIEEAVVAEQARWGGGWWQRDEEWDTERARLLDGFFPYRTDELRRQFSAAGWLPLPAPVLSVASGELPTGAEVTVEVPDGTDAELVYTVDGTDPRLPGGAEAPSAFVADAAALVAVDHGRVVSARLRSGEVWGPLEVGRYTVDEPTPLVLNEWNAVRADETLRVDEDEPGSGADDALGTLPGNGGPWIELVVTEAVDLRGWRLTAEDLRGEAGSIQLGAVDALAALQPGTILTLAADLPEDLAVDPARGDWRLHLQLGGDAASGEGLRVSAYDWRLSVWDADGHLRLGPVGEGVAPRRGVSGREVGALLADPGPDTRAEDEGYAGHTRSTFGAPNCWDERCQDLSALRQDGGGPLGVVDTGAPSRGSRAEGGDGGGCDTGGAGTGALGLLLALALLAGCSSGLGPDRVDTTEDLRPCFGDRDGDGHGDPAVSTTCKNGVAAGDDCDDTDARVYPGAGERCGGGDEDCDGRVDDADDDLVDGLPFYADGDGDGHGDPDSVVTACAAGPGAVVDGGDCDDTDPGVHPGAEEGCDGVDLDCDGVGNSGLGGAASCPAASCAEILTGVPDAEDGAYWLTLPSGKLAAVWCDMEGGGWTLGFVRNSASLGNQGEFGAAEVDLASLAISPEEGSLSATPQLGSLDLNTLEWDELRLTGAYVGARSATTRAVPRTALRLAFGEPGYFLYGGDTGYWWCGGPASYTDAGVGAVNNPADAPADCKGHGSLGSGWDFSESTYVNAGLTLCGADGSAILTGTWGGTWVYYGYAGGAQAIWVR